MAAICVAQAPQIVVIFREEKRGVGAVVRVLVKEPVHRSQEALRLIQSDCTLAAEVRLQIGHQESGGDSFSCNVTDHDPEPPMSQIKEIVVVSTDLASLDADTRVFERCERRQRLGEQPCLDLFRDFQFLGSAPLGFLLLCNGAAVRFDGPAHLVLELLGGQFPIGGEIEILRPLTPGIKQSGIFNP